MPLTPADRRRNGRKGALTTLLRSDDWTELTAPAREAFRAKFERQVDPDGKLTPAERTQRAEVARRLYYHELADRSRKARAARRAAQAPAPIAAAAGE
jgi:hypothetical protein